MQKPSHLQPAFVFGSLDLHHQVEHSCVLITDLFYAYFYTLIYFLGC